MEKSDLREIRKAVKSKDNCISWVYSLYVDPDNNPSWENVTRLADMEDAERFRHLDMFAKTLGTGIGKESFPVMLSDHQEHFLELRHAAGRDTAEFAAFRDSLLENYTHTDPYYATLARVIYDVPMKAGDGRKLEDGDQVYEALLFSICPASLSKPVLGFEIGRVAELDRRWQIGRPVSGFLYPAFSDRGEDRNQVLVHSKSPENEDYLRMLFSVSEEGQPVGIKTQKDMFASLLDQMDMSLECAAAISEGISEKAAEEDVTVIGKEMVKAIASSAGADTGAFDEIYDDTIGGVQISAAAVSEQYVTVKTDSAVIRIPTDRAQLIETRCIDGREYILIPADGTVTVNGAAVTSGGIAISSGID